MFAKICNFELLYKFLNYLTSCVTRHRYGFEVYFRHHILKPVFRYSTD